MVRFQKVQYILSLRHEIELQVFTLLSQYRSAWYLYWYSIYVEFKKTKENSVKQVTIPLRTWEES